jgi:hypothetical protein
LSSTHTGFGFTQTHIEAIAGIEELIVETEPMLTSAITTMIRYALGANMFMPPNDKFYLSRLICDHVCLILGRKQIAFEFLREVHQDLGLIKKKELLSYGYYPYHDKAPVLPLRCD